MGYVCENNEFKMEKSHSLMQHCDDKSQSQNEQNKNSTSIMAHNCCFNLVVENNSFFVPLFFQNNEFKSHIIPILAKDLKNPIDKPPKYFT